MSDFFEEYGHIIIAVIISSIIIAFVANFLKGSGVLASVINTHISMITGG